MARKVRAIQDKWEQSFCSECGAKVKDTDSKCFHCRESFKMPDTFKRNFRMDDGDTKTFCGNCGQIGRAHV